MRGSVRRRLVDKVPENIVEMCDYDGKLLAMPLGLEAYSIAYNKDLFEEAGIEELPTTITELREVCEQLEAAGIQPFINAYTDVAHVVRRMFTTPFATGKMPWSILMMYWKWRRFHRGCFLPGIL